MKKFEYETVLIIAGKHKGKIGLVDDFPEKNGKLNVHLFMSDKPLLINKNYIKPHSYELLYNNSVVNFLT